MMQNSTQLVGDIGGTNCRLALIRDGKLLRESIATYADASYPSLVAAIRAYLQQQRTEIHAACLAIAGPITGDEIKLTDNAWHFSIAQTRRELGLSTLEIINDFEAIALALPHLDSNQIEQIGGTESKPGQPNSSQTQPSQAQPYKTKVAIGPGTGYGAAKVIRCGQRFVALSSEGGHVTIAPSSQRELALCAWLLRESLQITREQLLSGPGLERIYRGICSIDGIAAKSLRAADIQTHAIAGNDDQCIAALHMFCDWLGTAARDQALDAMALGGVYIAGGIVKRFIPFLRASGFRQRFENSDTMRPLLEPIPVYVITEEYPGLLGAAAQLSFL
ncbi:MAG: glucokinase [Spongiibacteraceae bacterium]